MTERLLPEEAFALYLDRSGGDEACWNWTGPKYNTGYGKVGARSLAHRFAYLVLVGPIPEGLMVLHKCPGNHNRLCCNPNHLYLGTDLENQRDRALNGTTNRGERQWNHKLTADQVREIRQRHEVGGVPQKQLAEEYRVGRDQISRIITRKRWAHID